jgi:hypothetical protein
VAYQATPRLQLGLRGEVLKDIDGFDTGLPQTLWDITAGFNFKFAEWLVALIRVPSRRIQPQTISEQLRSVQNVYARHW